MKLENLFLNTLTFNLPKEPVKCYFSASNDANHQSTIIKSTTLTPSEVRQSPKFIDLFSGNGDSCLFTSFDKALKGFEAVAIDFSDPNLTFLQPKHAKPAKPFSNHF